MRFRALGNTGANLSIIGFGASPLGDVFGTVDPAEGTRAVRTAFDLGINFFDVSPYYGQTLAETRLGEALGPIRNQVFLATKCGRYGAADFDFSASRIRTSVQDSLRRLRTDHIDLLQAHDIEFGSAQQIVEETIPAMLELRRQGLVRFVGVTGYPLRMLLDVARAVEVDALLSYCRYNLLVNDLDDVLTPFTQQRHIGLLNASPLHMGLLTDAGPPPWHPAPPEVKTAAAHAAALCRARGADLAAIALQFCLRYPVVTSTLVGMATVGQVKRNVAALDLSVEPDLMLALRQLLAPVHNMLWPSGRPENADVALTSGESRR